MKKSLLYYLPVIALLLIFSSRVYAVKHIVNVQNYAFVPANLNVQVGDTIRWVWINGSHTTTSTTIPTGAPAWDEPITSSNPFYEYRVTVAGVYNYLCIPHSSTQIGQFTATNPTPTLNVTPLNQNVTASSGSTNFTVTSNSNWTASSNQGWCTVTSSGSGNGTLVANYTTNTVTTQRIATITITVSGLPSTTVTVTQAGASPTLTVTPSNQNVMYLPGSTNFTVSSNSSWTAISDDDWCVVTPSGNGNGVITASYGQNALSTPRIATISVNVSGLPTQTVTVTQAGFVATLSVTPSNINATAEAGSANFSVTSNSDWTASSSAGWVTVPSSGSGNATLTVTYQANPNIEPRVAAVIVSVPGSTSQVTITQAGAAVILEVSPLNQNVTYQAGSTAFAITSNAQWTATSSDPWIMSTSDGTGNGTLVVEYQENTSNEVRIATIAVGAPDIVQLITVTQEGFVSVIDNPLTGIKVFPNPSDGVVEITSDKTGLSVIKVMDLKGNVILSKEINNLTSYQLDLSYLSEGTYLFRLDNDGKSFISRIVLVK
ncbi:MAG TPA: BACON domain-containing carbohydrate-binding protein [Lentimicrobium sp.]|nr:BACON domain-containing carbohydrate-binding protein [Lentimicrobium sp.]